jgi:hypothetical protein
VNEDVLLPVPCNEPVPLRIAEPLHLTGCHSLPPTRRLIDPISDGHRRSVGVKVQAPK